MGQTYPHRNTFKTMGGTYVGPNKTWRIPFTDTALKDLDKFCRKLGGGPKDANPSSLETKENEPMLISEAEESVEDIKVPAHSPDQNGYRVSEILDIIGATISRTFSKPMWVIGEVQNVGNRGGRIYFNLAEQANSEVSGSTLSVSAVIWNDAFYRLEKKLGKDKVKELLQDGLTLRVLCLVQFYKGRASVSLSVVDLDPEYTHGALALAREKLLKELRSKGLDLANKKRSLSAFPFKVGLVSAENSRAASDFLDQLKQGKFCGDIYFCHAAMQGEASPPEVCAALKRLVLEDCDVIVITRGGGSAADLRWFDTPEIAYAIVHCPIPVISAIGHHDDRCVAEEISYQREKTPTAAAEFILSSFEKTELRIDQCVQLIKQRLEHAYNTLFERQNFLKERLKSAANETLVRKQEALMKHSHALNTLSLRNIHQNEQVIANLQSKMVWQTNLFMERLGHGIQNFEQALKTHDPRPWLKRGWTQLWMDQKQIQSVDELEEGSLVWTRLLDGLVKLEVKEKVKKENNHE